MADLDDLDDFLYGDTQLLAAEMPAVDADSQSEITTNSDLLFLPPAPVDLEAEQGTPGELIADREEVPDEADDESEESDVEFIMEVPTKSESTAEDTPKALVNLKPSSKPGAATGNDGGAVTLDNQQLNGNSTNQATSAGVNVLGVTMYEGKPLTEVDLESFADKLWRKPGADITDYFNYGFTEDTWRVYCERQRQLREEQVTQKCMSERGVMPMSAHGIPPGSSNYPMGGQFPNVTPMRGPSQSYPLQMPVQYPQQPGQSPASHPQPLPIPYGRPPFPPRPPMQQRPNEEMGARLPNLHQRPLGPPPPHGYGSQPPMQMRPGMKPMPPMMPYMMGGRPGMRPMISGPMRPPMMNRPYPGMRPPIPPYHNRPTGPGGYAPQLAVGAPNPEGGATITVIEGEETDESGRAKDSTLARSEKRRKIEGEETS